MSQNYDAPIFYGFHFISRHQPRYVFTNDGESLRCSKQILKAGWGANLSTLLLSWWENFLRTFISDFDVFVYPSGWGSFCETKMTTWVGTPKHFVANRLFFSDLFGITSTFLRLDFSFKRFETGSTFTQLNYHTASWKRWFIVFLLFLILFVRVLCDAIGHPEIFPAPVCHCSVLARNIFPNFCRWSNLQHGSRGRCAFYIFLYLFIDWAASNTNDSSWLSLGWYQAAVNHLLEAVLVISPLSQLVRTLIFMPN